ncbi:MAG TPA: hypothetical protein VE665_01470 [Hyphomicrobiaceae bacterium]|nr:hypothetical protein [Hyphomicrobiaceae bacterium]
MGGAAVMGTGFGEKRSMLKRGLWLGAVLALLGAGCTHERLGPVEQHYMDFGVQPPRQTSVSVCHAYGCRQQTRFTFGPADIAEIAQLMAKTRKADTPYEERRAVAYAISWMETRVGNVIGTKDDRPGMDFAASGDPTQQDCVDEATNTTSYLLVLQNQDLLKHHAVGTPFAKDNYLRGVAGWTHWTAVLKEKSNGQRWAVDSWIYQNGENPAIVEAEQWYINSLAELPKSAQ